MSEFEDYKDELERLRAQAGEAAEKAADAVESELEDFDAYWRSVARKGKTTTIMGRTVELPPALPLQFELEANRLQHSKRDEDVRKLVAILFGADAYEHFAEAGMDIEQFQLLLAWAPQVIAGRNVSLATVAAELAEIDEGAPGEG